MRHTLFWTWILVSATWIMLLCVSAPQDLAAQLAHDVQTLSADALEAAQDTWALCAPAFEHVAAWVDRLYAWEASDAFARTLAQGLQAAVPEAFVRERLAVGKLLVAICVVRVHALEGAAVLWLAASVAWWLDARIMRTIATWHFVAVRPATSACALAAARLLPPAAVLLVCVPQPWASTAAGVCAWGASFALGVWLRTFRKPDSGA